MSAGASATLDSSLLFTDAAFSRSSTNPMDSVTSFFLAIKNNDAEVVEKLLSTKSVDVDHKFAPENKPAVFLAVECGHREIVARLVRYGCSVNQGDRRGETPLHQAVRDRRKDLMEILLKERAKISVLNSDRLNPLHLAVYLRCLDVVKLLLASETDPASSTSLASENHLTLIFPSDYTGIVSPFSLACSKGYDEIIMFFLSFLDEETARKYLQRRRLDNTNPFHYVLRLDEETVLALIETLPITDLLVSSPNDYMKWSPLHRIAQADHLLQTKSGRMANILLTRANAPCDVRDLNGRTPLHLAIMRRNEPVIEALLRAGCRNDIRDHHGNSPLHYASLLCVYNSSGTSIIERLLAFGVDLNREAWITATIEMRGESFLVNALNDLKMSNVLNCLQRLCRNTIRRYLKARADEASLSRYCKNFNLYANTMDKIPERLERHMEMVDVLEYTNEEKLIIAEKHLINPSSDQNTGINSNQLLMSSDGLNVLIKRCWRESGVRNLQEHIEAIFWNAASKIASEKIASIEVTPANLCEFIRSCVGAFMIRRRLALLGLLWRYQVSEAVYKRGGPIFVMIGGEGPIDAHWLTYGQMYQNAIAHGALMFQPVHRFYAGSHPTSDLSVANLQYLSSTQALADLDAFIKGMKEQYKIPDAKVVVFGGSYPGSLVVWYRELYPDSSVGGVASSAPVLAEEDCVEYMETVGDAQNYYNPECFGAVSDAFQAIQDLLAAGNNSALDSLFGICGGGKLNYSDPYDVQAFYANLVAIWMGYTQDNSVGDNSTVADLCHAMTNPVYGDPIERFAKIFKTIGEPCVYHDYQSELNVLKNESWISQRDEEQRQWRWQCCTELGDFLSTDSKDQPFGYETVPLKSLEDFYCTQPFGIMSEDIADSIALHNKRYGGKAPNATNVFLFNGSIDPWHPMGIYEHDLNESSPSRYIEGIWKTISVLPFDWVLLLRPHFAERTSHCYDMYESRPDDPPALTEARQEMADAISSWLAD